MLTRNDFMFRSSDRIGYAAAEQDIAFLVSCFEDNGQYDSLIKGDLPSHIVLGRTGAGKTALLERIETLQPNVIELDPEQLALHYITNSTVLRFLGDLDVDLDLFFGLLWRHVIVVEVLRSRYKIRDAESKQHFFSVFMTLFQEPRQQRALEYLDRWGSSFWYDADARVKEVTAKIEDDVRSEASAHYPGLLAKIEAGKKFSTEEKIEYKERFSKVISGVQIAELSNVIDLLNSILDDPQNQYFVLIDHLDEKWVDDNFKTRIIRALLKATRRFLSARNLRIIIALRFDLYDRILSETRASHQQEEKIHALASYVRWTRPQLTSLLDQRINRLVKQRYTKRAVSHSDIFPKEMSDGNRREKTIDWILDRTFMRPRDVIQFVNFSIQKAVDSPEVSEVALLQAEGEYSRDRLNAVADEYSVTYPNLSSFSEILYGRPEKFKLLDLEDLDLMEAVQAALSSCNGTYDRLREWADSFMSGIMPLEDFRRALFFVFYEVGIVGLQKARTEPVSWTYESRKSLSRAEITGEARVLIHPMFWRRLGTRRQEPLINLNII